MFGLCQDYEKIILYSKLELVLLRARSDVDLIADSTKDLNVSVELSKVVWKLPVVEVSDIMKLRMSKIL